jgi:8-oxo-dGTP diphosphatase
LAEYRSVSTGRGIPAGLLGIDVRQLARWESGETTPRPLHVWLLSQTYELAPEELNLPPLDDTDADRASYPGAEVLRVAVAVVTDGSRMLLVCRRDESGVMSWQFPSGVVKPGTRATMAAVRETLAETGIQCSVREPLGSRLHPVTRVFCEYFLCDYLAGSAEDFDVIENMAVTWVDSTRLTDFIPVDRLFPPILTRCVIDQANLRTDAR